MRFARPALVLLLSILFCVSVAAQPPPRRDPLAVAVLQQSLAAMGGSSVTQIQDTVIQATVTRLTRPPSNAPATIRTKGADKIRWDSSVGRPSGVIFNRGRRLHLTDGGWQARSGANALHKRIEHLPALFLTYELTRTNVSVIYVGSELLDGRAVHRIRVARVSRLGNDFDEQLTKNSELEVFISLQTLRVEKVSYIYLSETDWRRGAPREIYYGDYQNVSGVLVPFFQRTVFGGSSLTEMRITSVATNVGLPDSLFEGR